MPDAVAVQLAHQQRGVIAARMPRAGHTDRERAGHPGPLRPPGHRHALPHRPGHQRTRLPRPAPRPGKAPGAAGGHTGMHTRLGAALQAGKHAASAARPWPSVKQPTVRTDRDRARIPSAMRPWTPQHAGLQRHKATHGGTEKKRPASRESPASGPFSQVWQVLGSNQRRLSRRFYSPLLPVPPYARDLRERRFLTFTAGTLVRYMYVHRVTRAADPADSHVQVRTEVGELPKPQVEAP